MRDGNITAEELSMDSINRLNMEEGLPANSLSDNDKGKSVDVEMKEVEMEQEDVRMGEDGEILQIVHDDMVVDEEGFPVVSPEDLPPVV